MLPRLTIDRTKQGWEAHLDAVHFGQERERCPGVILLAKHSHQRLIENGSTVAGTEGVPFLLLGIFHVPLLGPEEQVIRVAAGSVVTLVEGAQTFRDGSVFNLPSNPMCSEHFAARAVHPIPVAVMASALVFPTLVRFFTFAQNLSASII
jgi:hypothetical protein